MNSVDLTLCESNSCSSTRLSSMAVTSTTRGISESSGSNIIQSEETMARYLITGGAGFIGSHLCESFLSQGHEVICMDNYSTGSKQNVGAFLKNPRFRFND